MTRELGNVAASSTVQFLFGTYAGDGSSVAPSSAFEAADLRIYKDGSATQRTSANGITMTSPFDSLTGMHHVAIDLSDDTDAGFYETGAVYEVVLAPDETIDSLAVNAVLARFTIVQLMEIDRLINIEDKVTPLYVGLVLQGGLNVGSTGNDTTHVHIGGLLTYGDDELNDHLLVVYDSSAGEAHARWIEDYVASSGLATVDTLPFTPADTDSFVVLNIRRDVVDGPAVADAILDRNIEGGGSGTRTVGEALAFSRNRVAIDRDGGIFTVYQSDDTTPWFSGAISTESGDAISEINPS